MRIGFLRINRNYKGGCLVEEWIKILLTVITSVVASSGVWAYVQKRLDSKDVKTTMLIGLAHDRIVYLGMHYIERGWITKDEYENLYEYLYKPYEALGGNGSATRIIKEVNKLPIRNVNIVALSREEINNVQ